MGWENTQTNLSNREASFSVLISNQSIRFYGARQSLLATKLFDHLCAASKSYNLIAFIARLKSQTSMDVGSVN